MRESPTSRRRVQCSRVGQRITLHTLEVNQVQNSSVTSQCRASCRRKRVTHERSNTNNTLRLHTLNPNSFAHIDDPLQLVPRNSRVLENMRHARKVQRMKLQLSMQVKLPQKHVESEYICAVEMCGAKSQHTYARKIHEISDRDDGGASSISVSVCFLCARNATSRERIERRRGVKSDWIDGNEELLAEIDTTNQRDSKNVRKGDIACGDGSARASLCLNDTWVNDRVPT